MASIRSSARRAGILASRSHLIRIGHVDCVVVERVAFKDKFRDAGLALREYESGLQAREQLQAVDLGEDRIMSNQFDAEIPCCGCDSPGAGAATNPIERGRLRSAAQPA